ncbi:MAG: hypothetical protein JW982_02190 [Spirochaetes bacterium]|nr:hypothetical protein [Spirochaetota bacterium]
MLKKISLIVLISSILLSLGSCKSLKKTNVTLNDVKVIAKLINMDFGKGPNGPFKVKKTTSSKPVLIIDNQTDRTITVAAEGPDKKTFVVNSKMQQTANVASGNYHFKATARDTNGCEGDVELAKFNEYTWIFVIK